jgi:hypothetical protein
MQTARKMKSVLALVAAASLVACGGGSDTPAAPSSTGPSAEGVWSGALVGSTSNAFELLVLENGEYWGLYGTNASNVFYVNGFLQGSGTSTNGSFTSSNTRDFGFAPAVAGSVTATYNTATPSISGTATSALGSITFSGGAIAGSLYTYSTPASLSTITGAWSLTDLGGEGVSLNVAANGALTANSSGGCTMTGSVLPRPSGKNVFNVALTFGPAPCDLAGQNVSGIAVAYPTATGATELVVAVIDGTRTYGTTAFGTR